MAYDIGPSVGITGEREFKAAIANINNEFKLLGSEMKLAVSQFDKNDKSTAALTAQNQVLGKEMDSQKGRISTLTTQYDKQNGTLATLKTKLDETKAAFSADSAEVAKAQKEYDKQSTAVTKLGADLNTAKTGLNNMGRELDANNLKIKTASTEFKGLSDNINNKVNGALKGLAVGIGAAVVGMGALIMKSAENADKIQTTADIYGMTAERVQELTYVGTKLDVELDVQLNAYKFLAKSMYAAKEGTGAQADAFKALGISVVDGNGKLRDSKDVMGETFDALGKMSNETERDAITMKLLGKSAMELNPLIKAGSEVISKYTKEANDCGAVLSNETIIALDTFDDSVGGVKLQLQGAVANAFAPLIPKLQEMADKLKNIDTKPLTDGLKWVMDNGQTIVTVILSVVGALLAYKVAVVAATVAQEVHNAILVISALAHGGLSTATVALTAATGGKVAATLIASGAFIAHNIALAASAVAHGIASAAIGVATAAQWLFNAAMSANPIGLVILAVAALIAIVVLIVKNWGTIGPFFVGLWEGIKSVFAGIGKWFGDVFNGAWNGIKTAFSSVGGFFQGIWDGMKSGFSSVVNFLIDGINSLVNFFLTPLNLIIKGLNLIPGVKIPELKLSIPHIPKFDVGTRFLPQDMLIQAHKGEMIVPRSENPYANSGGGTMPQNTGDMVFNFDMGGGVIKTVRLTSEQIAAQQRQRISYKAVIA